MRRRFWTFIAGAPGAGLLLIRLATGAVCAYRGIGALSQHTWTVTEALPLAQIVAAYFVMGLWTTVAGVVLTAIACYSAFSSQHDPWVHVLMATLGVAVVFLGPGAWSIDARLFGWKRIDIPSRRSDTTTER